MSDTGGAAPTGTPPVPGWGSLEVHPGSGVVHRGPDVLLVVPTVSPALVEATSELVALCGDVPDPTGRRRVRRAARLLTEAEPEDLPEFALVIDAGDHLTVLVHGDVTVSVTGEQDLSFSAAESLAWVERVVPLPYETVTIDSPSGRSGRAALEPARGLPLDLLAGTVPGGGATLQRGATATSASERTAEPGAQELARVLERPAYLRSRTGGPAKGPAEAEVSGRVPAGASAAPDARREPGHAAEPAAAAEPVTAAPAGSRDGSPPAREASDSAGGRTVLRQTVQVRRVSLARHGRPAGGARRAPLPVGAATGGSLTAAHGQVVLIEGVLCPAGHLNEPGAGTCAPCGAPMGAASPRVTQPRPPLGVLVTDEGAVYTVTTDYVIGRDPEHAPDVVAGRARALVLRDAENSTSRVHARLTVSGWEVQVTDSGSANGTFVSSGGPAGPWNAVYREPGTPLRPGDRVRLGKRQLLFDRYHLPSTPLQAAGREGSGGSHR